MIIQRSILTCQRDGAQQRDDPGREHSSGFMLFGRGMILDRTEIHYNGWTIILGYLIFGPSLECRRSRETAALRLPASWLYPLDPHYITDKSHFRRRISSTDTGDRSRMKIEEIREGKEARVRDKEGILLTLSFSLSLLGALTSMSFVVFFLDKKNANRNASDDG